MGTRVYRTSRSQCVVSLLLLLVGLVFLVATSMEALRRTSENSFWEVTAALLFSLFAGFFVVRAFHNTVSLTETAIQVRDLFDTAVLPLDKIEGRRRYISRGDGDLPSVTHLVLVPNDDRLARLDIEEIYQFDNYFYAWFNDLPDLDEPDRNKKRKARS